MATGRSGGCGKSVPGAAAKGTGAEAERAAAPRLSTAGGPARAAPWTPSCATSGLAQVR